MNQSIVSESARRSLKFRREYHLAGECVIYLLDGLPEHLSISNIVDQIKKCIPENLLYGLDAIYIGNYKELAERDVESVYYAGAIYIKPSQKSDEDLVSDIVHEIAHSIEENFSHMFSLSSIQSEFTKKRKTLYDILNNNGHKLDKKLFLDLNYSEELDNVLYKEVGYNKINMLANNLFISPYAATSLREYFANGFENYFYKSKLKGISVKDMFSTCPKLLNLLYTLTDSE